MAGLDGNVAGLVPHYALLEVRGVPRLAPLLLQDALALLSWRRLRLNLSRWRLGLGKFFLEYIDVLGLRNLII